MIILIPTNFIQITVDRRSVDQIFETKTNIRSMIIEQGFTLCNDIIGERSPKFSRPNFLPAPIDPGNSIAPCAGLCVSF